jgi:hypothetical protein
VEDRGELGQVAHAQTDPVTGADLPRAQQTGNLGCLLEIHRLLSA